MDNEYAQELTKHAIVRAAAGLGIKQIRAECLDSLADVIRHYVQSIGVATKENAELSGRAMAGIQDLIPALEHVHPVSTRWNDLRTFAFANEVIEDEDGEKIMRWNQPFPFEVPAFPIDTSGESYGDVNDLLANQTSAKDSREPYIPAHLPPYPHSQTYKKSSGSRKRSHSSVESDLPTEKRTKSNVVKSARQSLSKLEDCVDEVAVINQQSAPSSQPNP